MTTAYTSLLGLALPVTGELSGTWGDTVNDSITSLLDSAVAGTTTISSDADVTLTTTTGASNTSRQAILLWTAGGTVTRNITAPAQSKIYTVINKSSSTQSIVLRGAGPTTGVTIVQGESAVCAWNGSDFIKISNTSGAGVFTTLSVSGAVTLSGGTANGVAYLNGSKVLTTGSALTFDGTNFGVTTIKSTTSLNLYAASAYDVNLYTGATNTARLSSNVSGIFTVGNVGSVNSIGTDYGTLGAWGSAGGGYRIYRGTGAGTSIAYLYADGTGVFLAGLENVPMSFTVNGSEAMRIASATGGVGAVGIGYTSLTSVGNNGLAVLGNVGIGTSSPGYKLDVSGYIRGLVNTASVGNASSMQLTQNGSGDAAISFLIGATTEWLAGVDNSDSDSFKINNITGGGDFNGTGITLTTSGNLGLGVTPSAWNTSQWTALEGAYGGALAFYKASNVPVTVLTSNAYNDGSWKYKTTDPALQYEMDGNVGIHKWYNAPSGTAGNAISFTQAMTLDSSGNLGIGNTDPTNNGTSGYNNLVIGNSSSSTCGLTFKTASTGTPLPGIVWSRGAGTGVNGKVYYDQSTDRLYCLAGGSGGVYLAGGGTSWTSASDERVKDIIEPIENATQKLANWRTVIGKYKSDTDGVRRSFLIAQDVLTTFPEAVNTDKAEEYGLNYQDLIPLLVASIQELKAEFDAYKASHP
jgi:hypothetical protein